MSIGAFFVEPRDACEKSYYFPVLTEELFREAVLPVADEINARFVPLFETGIELSFEDACTARFELLAIVLRLKCEPKTARHVADRLEGLASEIRRILEAKQDARIFIG